MSVNEKMTAIADAIREKTGGADKLTLDDMAQSVSEMYDAGKQSAYDEFWDKFQNYGYRTDYSYMFNGNWYADDFKPKYNMKLTSSLNMFYNFGITNDTRIDLRNIGVEVDFSNNVQMRSTFNYAYGITAIAKIVNNKSSSLDAMFTDCINLHTIELLELNISCTLNNTFRYCSALKNITIGGTIEKSISFAWSPLTKASITSVINALSAAATGQTLTLKTSAVNNAFETSEGAADGSTSDEWAALIATKTNWTISLA